MICKKCGKEINDTAKFCGYCGCANIYDDVANADFDEENITIKSEIRQNVVIFALPIIYLIWQIVKLILSAHFVRMGVESYFSFAIAAYYIGRFLFGTINGGLTVVVRNCTKRFRWIYLLPYILVCAYYFVLNIDSTESIVINIFEFLEIIVSMVVIMMLKNTRMCSAVSLKSTVIISAAATVAYFIFNFLSIAFRALIFGASTTLDFTYIIAIVVSIIGSVIGATIAFYWKSKEKLNSISR